MRVRFAFCVETLRSKEKMRTPFAWIFLALALVMGKSASTPTANFFKFENETTHGTKDVRWKERGSGKIVGGTPAEEGRYPYAATLVTNGGELVCGGTHISPSFVLSAAHCAGYASKVYIGRYLLNETSGSQTVGIKKEIVYKAYDSNTDDGDFMLIRLRQKITGGTFPRLSRKDFTSNFTDQTVLTTIGWGATTEGGSISNTLLEVDVKYVPRKRCKKSYSTFGWPVTKLMICAGGLEGKDSCQGDSGGALLAKKQNASEDVVLGVTSWGYGCAAGYPGVYARVGKAEKWITKKLGRLDESVTFV